MTRVGFPVFVIVIALVAAPRLAVAGGLFVPGAGPQAQARAGAFVAKADDPTALIHNPAGFAIQKGTTIYIGFNLVNYDLGVNRDGQYDSPVNQSEPYDGHPFRTIHDQSKPAIGLGEYQAIPFIGVATDFGLGEKVPGLGFGIGVYAPHGFPERDIGGDYEFEEPGVEPPPTRYDIVHQEAASVLPSIAVAYNIMDIVSIGARFSFGTASIDATTYVWGVRNYEEWVPRDGVFTVDVSDNFVPSYGIGLHANPFGGLEIGFAYNSKIEVKAKGKGTATIGSDLGLGDEQEYIVPENEYFLCAGGGTEEALKACVDLTLPQTVSGGMRWVFRRGHEEERRDLGDVELDVKWEDWSAASDVPVIVDGKSGLTGLPLNPSVIRHGFEDVVSVRLGGSYIIPLGGDDTLTVRGGVAYDTAAAPTKWTRADLDGAARTTFATGASLRLGTWVIDAGGGFVLEPDRTVPYCNPSTADPDACAAIFPEGEPAPDPIQPLQGPNNQLRSPFNGGEYRSHYVLFSLGASKSF